MLKPYVAPKVVSQKAIVFETQVSGTDHHGKTGGDHHGHGHGH